MQSYADSIFVYIMAGLTFMCLSVERNSPSPISVGHVVFAILWMPSVIAVVLIQAFLAIVRAVSK